MADSKSRAIASELQKRLGSRCQVHLMGDRLFAAQPKEWISTGVTLLDAAIGGRHGLGVPFGKVVELYGPPHGGKSLLCASIMREAAKQGAILGLEDTEEAWSVEFLEEFVGTPADEVYYFEPENLEDCWETANVFMEVNAKTNTDHKILCMVIDGLGGISSRAEQEAGMQADARIAAAAMVNRKGIRLLLRKFAKERMLVVVTNHETTAINTSPWAEKTTTTGGTGPRFFASIRIRLRPTKKLYDKEGAADRQQIGNRIQATVIKNRHGASGQSVEFDVYFSTGIDDRGSVVNYLWEHGLLGMTKGWVEWQGKKMRRAELLELARTNEDAWSEIRSVAIQHVTRIVGPVTDVTANEQED